MNNNKGFLSTYDKFKKKNNILQTQNGVTEFSFGVLKFSVNDVTSILWDNKTRECEVKLKLGKTVSEAKIDSTVRQCILFYMMSDHGFLPIPNVFDYCTAVLYEKNAKETIFIEQPAIGCRLEIIRRDERRTFMLSFASINHKATFLSEVLFLPVLSALQHVNNVTLLSVERSKYFEGKQYGVIGFLNALVIRRTPDDKYVTEVEVSEDNLLKLLKWTQRHFVDPRFQETFLSGDECIEVTGNSGGRVKDDAFKKIITVERHNDASITVEFSTDPRSIRLYQAKNIKFKNQGYYDDSDEEKEEEVTEEEYSFGRLNKTEKAQLRMMHIVYRLLGYDKDENNEEVLESRTKPTRHNDSRRFSVKLPIRATSKIGKRIFQDMDTITFNTKKLTLFYHSMFNIEIIRRVSRDIVQWQSKTVLATLRLELPTILPELPSTAETMVFQVNKAKMTLLNDEDGPKNNLAKKKAVVELLCNTTRQFDELNCIQVLIYTSRSTDDQVPHILDNYLNSENARIVSLLNSINHKLSVFDNRRDTNKKDALRDQIQEQINNVHKMAKCTLLQTSYVMHFVSKAFDRGLRVPKQDYPSFYLPGYVMIAQNKKRELRIVSEEELRDHLYSTATTPIICFFVSIKDMDLFRVTKPGSNTENERKPKPQDTLRNRFQDLLKRYPKLVGVIKEDRIDKLCRTLFNNDIPQENTFRLFEGSNLIAQNCLLRLIDNKKLDYLEIDALLTIESECTRRSTDRTRVITMPCSFLSILRTPLSITDKQELSDYDSDDNDVLSEQDEHQENLKQKATNILNSTKFTESQYIQKNYYERGYKYTLNENNWFNEQIDAVIVPCNILTNMDRFDENIQQQELRSFIPSHWTLAVVYPHKGSIEYYNSLSGSIELDMNKDKVLADLCEFICCERMLKNVPHEINWNCQEVHKEKQQQDGIQSGMFVICNALCVLYQVNGRNWTAQDMQDFRLCIAIELLQGEVIIPWEHLL
jgi:hypothetical protein